MECKWTRPWKNAFKKSNFFFTSLKLFFGNITTDMSMSVTECEYFVLNDIHIF